MRRLAFVITLSALPFALNGCASPPAWTLYDACSRQTASFVAMAECGKAKREAACQSAHDCSTVGNAYVAFADALAERVRSGEISDGEARQNLAEYEMRTVQNAQRNQALSAAAMAASGPTTCNTIGTVTTCN